MMSTTLIPTAFFASIVLAAVVGGPNAASQPSGSFGSRAAASNSRLPNAARQDSVALYTEAQATAGAEVYTKVCASCHEKTDVTNADFKANWGGRTLYELYEEIRTTMPDDNPGALSREEYAGATAYILKLNGFVAGGVAVMPDSAAMAGAKLTFPPSAP
jgi:S-disulfanyl-L-cysteine oxidoreductase SoxD